jgi:nitronate monooxygenase
VTRGSIAELLGIRYPIVSAPMGMVAGGRLAAAVSEAGGLGLIGPGYNDARWIEQEFREARLCSTGLPHESAGLRLRRDASQRHGGASTLPGVLSKACRIQPESARVGVGFITWDLARSPDRLDAALACHPAAVMLSFGDATPFVDAIRKTGARVILQVQSLAAAKAAAELEPDIIVAQGTEAGGHGGGRALFPLLPAVVDAVAPIPVVAAGGIADGRGIVAAFALGASGVLIGTRFYAAAESLAPPAPKDRRVRSGGDATIRSRIFDIARRLPWPAEFTARALRNDFTKRWHGREAALEQALDQEQPRYARAVEAKDFDTAAVWAGEGIDLIQDVVPARQIVERLVADAEEAMARLTRLFDNRPGSP